MDNSKHDKLLFDISSYGGALADDWAMHPVRGQTLMFDAILDERDPNRSAFAPLKS